MIKKIICPTDFSEEAINATEYATHLAKDIGAELLLVNVQSVPIVSGVMLAGGLISDTDEKANDAADLLKKTCSEITREYNVEANYEVDITSQSLVKILSSVTDEDTMIVMGAKSSRNMRDFFFGTGTFTLIRKAKCPVLFVPENCSYGSYKNVVYTMAYEEKSRNALESFYEFIKPFHSNITILHISDHESELGRDLFRAESNEINEHFAGKQEFNFTQLYYKDALDAINHYMEKKPADLVVVAIRHRNAFEMLFKRKPLLAGLTAIPEFPVLVFHS